MKASMQRINVLSIHRTSAEDRAKIEAVDPAIQLTDAGGWYDGEIRETWPPFTSARHPHPGRPLPPGFTELGGAGDLDRFLPDSDFVVICCQWTAETTRLFDKDRFAAMKAGGVLINVARGEIVDEEALADALQRDHLRGAALDVYVGEFEHTPMARLWSDPKVLITPHISAASDQDRHGAINLFCANLRAYLDGGPLRNVIDWERGY